MLEMTIGDPGGDRGLMQYLKSGLFPVCAPAHLLAFWNGTLPPSVWSQLVERHRTESLRQLAKEYGISHEAIRRTLAAANPK
jgi:hypothetical protein